MLVKGIGLLIMNIVKLLVIIFFLYMVELYLIIDVFVLIVFYL